MVILTRSGVDLCADMDHCIAEVCIVVRPLSIPDLFVRLCCPLWIMWRILKQKGSNNGHVLMHILKHVCRKSAED